MKKLWMMTAVAAVGLAVVSCKREDNTAATGTNAGNAGGGGATVVADAGVVRKIDMPRYTSDIPDAEGREQFATACLSCHSTAYINMQPPMNATKWGEIVTKMAKTYGAPIADEQVKPIVSYLTAVTAGNGVKIRESAVAAAPTEVELIKPARDPGDQAEDAKRGDGVFEQLCASCHGTDRRGTGPAGLVLLPRPADLTAGKFTEEGVAHVLAYGMPGTAMASFAKVKKEDLRAVQAYVLTLAPDDNPASPQTPEGRELYLKNCAACHGAGGHGDGLAGVLLPRPAADFHLRRVTLDYAKQVIANGVPGTAMPAWRTKLDPKQRTLLAEYVRGFFGEK